MTSRAKPAPKAAGSGSGAGDVSGAPRAPSIPRKQAVFRIPACLMIHRDDLLHGLHLAGVADDWDVPGLYPAETIGNRKIALSREESEALDRICDAFKVTQRVAVTSALHHVRRSRLAATFVADCRSGGCRAVSCRAEFNLAVEAKAIARSLAARRGGPVVALDETGGTLAAGAGSVEPNSMESRDPGEPPRVAVGF